jgi:outer membrane protein assembly factor BamE (lipoprotein component of BamABCDE complex)
MKNVMMKVVFVCCFVVFLTTMSGCATYMSGAVPDRFKSQVVKGKTTKTDVLQELGNPDQKIDLDNGKQQFSYIKEEYRITPLSGLSANAGQSKNTEFWLTFDTTGAVVDFGDRPTSKTKNYFGGQQ